MADEQESISRGTTRRDFLGRVAVYAVPVVLVGRGLLNPRSAAAAEAECSFGGCETVLGDKQQVLDEINAAIPGASTRDARKLGDAAKPLADSVDPSLWNPDGNRLDPKNGEKVFQKEKEAVQKLVELLDDKNTQIDDGTLQGWIDALVGADQALAQTAIGNATSAGGDAKKLAEAAKEMSQAAAAAAAGKPADAIEHYKNAWKKAQESLK